MTLTPKTWQDGVLVTAADLNAQIRDPLVDLLGNRVTPQSAKDLVLAMLKAGTGTTLTYDPVAGTLTIGLSGTGSTGTLAKVATTGSAADLTGVLPQSALPPLAITDTFPVPSQAAMLALVAQRGDVAVRTDLTPTQMFILTADAPSVLANWLPISAGGAVASVAGRSGAVVLTKADVGLANADNTSDANKPLSAAAVTALRNTDAICRYTGTQPLRNTVTTDLARRVVWVSATQPTYATGYAIDGDKWERLP